MVEYLGWENILGHNLEVVKIDPKILALDGWNGEKWHKCFELDPFYFLPLDDKNYYTIEPIYEEDESGNFNIVDYKLL